MEISDPQVLRVLLNPVRSDLLHELAFAGGRARVSDLASKLDKPVNSISYHLRQLAKVGLIAKVKPDEVEDSRESWYQLTDEDIRVDIADQANRSAALRAMLSQMATRETSAVSRRRERAFASEEIDASRLVSMSLVFRLTQEQEQQIHAELHKLLERMDEASEANKAAHNPDTTAVYFTIESFPLID